MSEKNYKGNIAFFYRNSWYHRKRELLEDGTVKYTKLGGFNTPEEAEKSYYKFLNKFKEKQLMNISPIINKEIMFTDYLRYWFESIYSNRVRSTTKMVTSYTIYNLIIPNVQYDIKIKFITSEYIEEILERISKIGKSTANKGRQVLFLVFKEAILEGYISTNPIKNIKAYKKTKTKINILNKQDIKRFLMITSKDIWYLEILLALFCGLRKGEILGLKFSDINIENKSLKINRQLSINYKLESQKFEITERKYEEKEPKTENSYRTLRVPNIIIEELENRKKWIYNNKEKYKDRYIDNNYVCCQEDGNPRGISSLNTYINRICKRNSLPKITVHGLRHMYATILIEQGVNIAKISALLGHSSIHTTFENYCDVMNETENINAFMNNTFNFEEEENEFREKQLC